MALRWYTVVVDSHDIAAQARWWAETLDFQIVYEDEHEVAVIPKHMSEDVIEDGATWMRQAQGLVFVPVPEGKTVKNRLHIDLAPHTSQDRTPRSRRCSSVARPSPRSARTTTSRGRCWPTPRATSSACCPAATADGRAGRRRDAAS